MSQAGSSSTCFNDSLSPTSSFSHWRAKMEEKFAPRSISRFCFRSGVNDSPSRPLESEEDLQELRECYSRGLASHSKATTFRIAVIAERAPLSVEDSRARLGVQTRRQRTSVVSATVFPGTVSAPLSTRPREGPSGLTPASKKHRPQKFQ